MRDFLEQMARSSAVRVARAREREPERELRRRARDVPPAPRLVLSAAAFDLIAEVKRRSPSGGVLARSSAGAASPDVPAEVVAQAVAYAAGGAAAISVLTEPEHFDGDLSHLAAVARALNVPAMRKDFLVDPYQVLEARAAGAGGVLLIVRLLRGELLREMLESALESGLFVLLECFDAADIERAEAESASVPGAPGGLFLGLNVRDLTTFEIDGTRLERLAPCFPPGVPRVAESGIANPADARRAAGLGYAMALAGTALMQAPDPARATAAMIEAGRDGKEPRSMCA